MSNIKWISRKDAAEILGVHPQTISNYATAGVIHEKSNRGHKFFILSEIEALAASDVHSAEEIAEKTKAYEAELQDAYKRISEARADFHKAFRGRETWYRYKKVVDAVVQIVAGDTLTERGRAVIDSVLDLRDIRQVAAETGVSRGRIHGIIESSLRKMLLYPAQVQAYKDQIETLKMKIETLKDENAGLAYELEKERNPSFFKKEREESERVRLGKLLRSPLYEMGLSVRAYNCCKAADIETVGDLCSKTRSEMMKFRNFGRKSLAELDHLLETMGLSFGMNVNKYTK